MSVSSWRPPRRGVLPSTVPSLQSLATGPVIVRVWLAVIFLGLAGWLVTGGPSAAPVGPDGMAVSAPATVLWGLGLLTAGLWGLGLVVLRVAAPTTAARTVQTVLIGLLMLMTVGGARFLLPYTTWPVVVIPIAALGMPLTLLLAPVPAVVATVVTALTIGLMTHQSLGVALVLLAAGVTGIFTVRGARRRGHLIKAGFWSGTAQALAVVAVGLVAHGGWRAVLGAAAWAGAIGGIGAFVATIALLPVLEHLFGLITDITLLELSDLNHPLLKELSLKAPGTYHHSLIVATLAEAGCEAIGANGLLARVGCYFHDIGKLPKAEYFVENQPPARSRHDTLAPSMSSLIIINHVKEGIELARRYRLNQAIIDFIPGHHGTGLIYFFYRRALEQVEDERLLKEEQFRYPGPRPRARETAVAMLADSVEAACRALPARTPAKLLGVVRRIVNNKFIDGQLDECDLTLRDLERIAAAFVRVLTGIYHARVPYPVPPGEDVEESELEAGADTEPSRRPGAAGLPPAAGAAGAASA